MAQFAMLLFTPAPGDWETAPPEELEAHGAFGTVAEEGGVTSVAAYALHASSDGIAISDRGETITKGAFGDAKFVLGGFSVIEARDIDHAVEIAKQNPATWRGGVEVRPLLG